MLTFNNVALYISYKWRQVFIGGIMQSIVRNKLFKMRQVFILLVLFSIPIWGYSQSKGLEYGYDKAGNRTYRYVVLLPASPLKSAQIDIPPLEHNLGPLEIKIFPNPTQGQLLVDIQNGEDGETYSMHLYDISGKLLIEKKHKGNGSQPLNLSLYTPGPYILILKTPNGKMEYKIIKE